MDRVLLFLLLLSHWKPDNFFFAVIDRSTVTHVGCSNLASQQQRQSEKHQQQQQQLQQHLLQQLLRSGDIHSHPGPTVSTPDPPGSKRNRKVTNPCTSCEKGVTKASRAVSCDFCDKWTHIRCTGSVSRAKYDSCVQDGGDIAFICTPCSLQSLPFSGEENVDTSGGQMAGARAVPAPQVSASDSSSSSSTSSSTYHIPSILNMKGLHFLHSNVRSLLPKIPEVRHLMTRTKTAVFAASETCLDSSVNDSEIVIPGFSVVRKDRNRNGGGVALFIRDNIPFNTRPDLNVDGLEAVWVELLLPRSKGILVSAMYKPPNDADFLSKLDSTLSKIDPGSEMYVLGDMNIDISSNSIL